MEPYNRLSSRLISCSGLTFSKDGNELSDEAMQKVLQELPRVEKITPLFKVMMQGESEPKNLSGDEIADLGKSTLKEWLAIRIFFLAGVSLSDDLLDKLTEKLKYVFAAHNFASQKENLASLIAASLTFQAIAKGIENHLRYIGKDHSATNVVNAICVTPWENYLISYAESVASEYKIGVSNIYLFAALMATMENDLKGVVYSKYTDPREYGMGVKNPASATLFSELARINRFLETDKARKKQGGHKRQETSKGEIFKAYSIWQKQEDEEKNNASRLAKTMVRTHKIKLAERSLENRIRDWNRGKNKLDETNNPLQTLITLIRMQN